MTWKIEFEDAAAKELRKLDRQAQKEILTYLRNRIATQEDPRRFGKPLTHNLASLWRYRVQNYRIICNIEDKKLIVLIVRVAHRKEVYE
ncbi:MAG: type II toxin-antitoxin system mRNA interferase toxin, RelE/StbE family [Methylophaga sp.]|nr:MAG: type II toxin-antitoxin system mRNA interferase toxin, RelE/StbE family [Methylophaga sp.]